MAEAPGTPQPVSGGGHFHTRRARFGNLGAQLISGGPKEAWLQQLTGSTRVLAGMLLLVAVLIAHDAGVLLAIYFLCCLGAFLARLDLVQYLAASLLLVGVFVAPVAVLGALAWFVPGEQAVRLGPLVWTDRGLRQAGLLLIRALDAVAITTLLVRSLGARGTVEGMQQLGLPRSVGTVLLMALGHIALLARTAQEMLLGMRARTVGPSTFGTAYRTVAAHGVVLLSKSLQASRETHSAMLARGFSGDFPKIATDTPRWSKRDWSVAGLAAVVAAAAFLI